MQSIPLTETRSHLPAPNPPSASLFSLHNSAAHCRFATQTPQRTIPPSISTAPITPIPPIPTTTPPTLSIHTSPNIPPNTLPNTPPNKPPDSAPKKPLHSAISSVGSSLICTPFYAGDTLLAKRIENLNKPFFRQIMDMHQNGGVPRFYRGFSASLTAMTLSRAYAYGGTDLVKNSLTQLYPDTPNAPFLNFVSGGTASLTKALFLQPIENAKMMAQKMAQKPTIQGERPLNWYRLAYQSFVNLGIRGLYTGLSSSIGKSTVGLSIFMGVRAHTENQIDHHFSHPQTPHDYFIKDSIAGAVAGGITSICVHFFVVQKVLRSCGKYPGVSTYQLTKTCFKNNGLRGIFPGLILHTVTGTIQGGAHNALYRTFERALESLNHR